MLPSLFNLTTRAERGDNISSRQIKFSIIKLDILRIFIFLLSSTKVLQFCKKCTARTFCFVLSGCSNHCFNFVSSIFSLSSPPFSVRLCLLPSEHDHIKSETIPILFFWYFSPFFGIGTTHPTLKGISFFFENRTLE